MMEETITSRRNPLLAHTKKLLTSRAYREKSGEFAADGVKLLAEAARWYPGLHTVITEEHVELCKLSDTVRVVRVPRDVMQSVSLMDAPQGAIFLCRLPERKPGTILPGTLLLDGIQDPGNLGTILRTADALEVPVVLLDGTVLNTNSWKWRFTSSYIWLARRRRGSNIVSRNPSISNEGFSFVLIILIVFKSLLIPSSAKYSHCTGIITESAAVKALMVIKPKDGEQSIKM